ncbi:MAG: dynamin family protein [Deltaproteobacteria bacterium]|nr:dynamin family protein [Deltaproteobacteria bacterium]
MMSTFESVKNDLISVNREISELFTTAQSIPGISAFPFGNWEKAGQIIEEQLNEDILRVAVVGAIKSGKSTFVNAVLEGDYLKRGAGVVTSIVTRVRKGPALKARLIFKTWKDVNAEMEQAMVLFPSLEMNPGEDKFDIRRQKDRDELSQALTSLSGDQLISHDARDVNAMVLSTYLKGYDRVVNVLAWDKATTLKFEGNDFVKHKAYVGDDSLAVYLRDLELQIPARQNLDDNIEIADCQGSDSPNPLHLAMIQDYLLKTHLIIYLLSSRTGVRQADIKFLSMIRKMGLMENIIFIVNCDFNEHEDIEDLKSLLTRIQEEVAVMKPEPEMYAFSALFNLFGTLRTSLSEKDRLRLEYWEGESAMTEFSNRERKRFEADLDKKLTRDRFTLLVKNHVERLSVMAQGLRDWVTINRDILSKDADDARSIAERIKTEQMQMDQVRAMIKDTLTGASQTTKREIEKGINSFLDASFGDVIKDIQAFVRGYSIDTRNNAEDLDGMGFSATLYMVFQEFKHAMDIFMTETINPKLVHFIRQDEKKIDNLLVTVAGTYGAIVNDSFQRYESTLRNLGVDLAGRMSDGDISLNVESLKRTAGLAVPPLVSSLRYTNQIRTEAIVRLGFYNLVKAVKKLFKRTIHDEREGQLAALRDGVRRIKRETERSLVFHLNDYRENLKYQYVFKLVDVASENLYDMLVDRFQAFTIDISDMMDLVGKEHHVKEEAAHVLSALDRSIAGLQGRMSEVKKRMTS